MIGDMEKAVKTARVLLDEATRINREGSPVDNRMLTDVASEVIEPYGLGITFVVDTLEYDIAPIRRPLAAAA